MAVDGYHGVRERLGKAAERSGRRSEEITLVAVSKGRTVGEILDLYSAGHRDFGENRAQEMAAKVVDLPTDIRWHFVGSLQSNKVRLVRGQTHLLHSLDRWSLAKAWIKGVGEPPPVLIQVNIGREEQKGGVLPEATAELVATAVHAGLDVRGLMAIPPLSLEPEDSRPYFEELRQIAEDIQSTGQVLPWLSMGMTNDFEIAVEEGASFIRVGRAIFDPTH